MKYNIVFFTSETKVILWYLKGDNIKTVLIAMQTQFDGAL